MNVLGQLKGLRAKEANENEANHQFVPILITSFFDLPMLQDLDIPHKATNVGFPQPNQFHTIEACFPHQTTPYS